VQSCGNPAFHAGAGLPSRSFSGYSLWTSSRMDLPAVAPAVRISVPWSKPVQGTLVSPYRPRSKIHNGVFIHRMGLSLVPALVVPSYAALLAYANYHSGLLMCCNSALCSKHLLHGACGICHLEEARATKRKPDVR
jgi:hypothetical protein